VVSHYSAYGSNGLGATPLTLYGGLHPRGETGDETACDVATFARRGREKAGVPALRGVVVAETNPSDSYTWVVFAGESLHPGHGP